jgi:hypothetical protein
MFYLKNNFHFMTFQKDKQEKYKIAENFTIFHMQENKKLIV